MKYILIKDILRFFKENIKAIFIYIFILISFVLAQKIINTKLNAYLFLTTVGLNFSFESGLLEMLLAIFNISFYIFIAINIFLNDLEIGFDNLFLRMSRGKWFLFKLLSILLITFLFMFINYFYLLIIFYLFSVKINFIFIFISNYIYFVFLQILSLFVYLICKKYNKLIILVLAVVLFMIKNILLNLDKINNNIFVLIGLSFLILSFCYLKIRKREIEIFEI